MRRRILLTLAAVPLLIGAAWGRASAQCGAQVPPDRITLEELKKALADKNPPLILDVRAGAETKIKGAKYIPLDELESRLGELPRDREIVTYCSWPSEKTSARAAQILVGNKFRSRALLGGWDAWVKAGGETEPVKAAGGCGHKPGGCGKPGCGAKPPAGGCGKPPDKQKPQRL